MPGLWLTFCAAFLSLCAISKHRGMQVRCSLYGSRPPANDSLWAIAKKQGFEIVVHDRSAGNKEKKIDTTIMRDITKDSYETMKAGVDEFTLIAGDRDDVPVVEDLVARGFKFDVAFWDHASHELKADCSTFISLNGYLEHLRPDK